MRFMVVCIIALANHSAVGEMPDSDQTEVMREIIRLERDYGGHLGVMAKNLNSGEVVAYNASERFPTASAIKLPIMATFFHLVDQKLVDPNEQVVLKMEDKKGGSGILQFMSDGTTISLLDAVKLMIILSDNSGTNLVLDRLADSHEARMAVVNDFMNKIGLNDTRILNRLYTWETKLQTPEAIRYGIGVSTPRDMIMLLEALRGKTVADSESCDAMLDILRKQMYDDMIPRFLPAEDCKYLEVAHKTGGVNETKVDVGLISSDKATYVIAIFVDKYPDHREGMDNKAVLLAAHVSRAIWNHFTGSTGYYDRKVNTAHVDWNRFPGGSWAIYRSPAAPFPHEAREKGFTANDGTVYPVQPHYADSSITVFVSEDLTESENGTNVIVHFHGHMNDNMGVLERDRMPQAMIARRINALLILPQGPYRARDSFGGKMEDEGGLKRLIEDVLATMKGEGVLNSTKLNNVIISAHSGGYRPAAFVLKRGGLDDHITNVFLFDALYGQHEYFRNWLNSSKGFLTGAYTEHLADEHAEFEKAISEEARTRLRFTKISVDHNAVVQEFLDDWLTELDEAWYIKEK